MKPFLFLRLDDGTIVHISVAHIIFVGYQPMTEIVFAPYGTYHILVEDSSKTMTYSPQSSQAQERMNALLFELSYDPGKEVQA